VKLRRKKRVIVDQKMKAKVLLCLLILLTLLTEAEAKKVQVAVATLSQSNLPLVVAQERGYYKEEGLDVELVLMTGVVANLALIGGNVDFISTGGSAVSAIIRGAPLRFVFVCFNRPMHWLFSRPEIRDVRGLKRKKIGVSGIGGSPHFLILEVLKKYGVDGNRDATVLAVGTTANRYAALVNGTVDATNLTPPFNFKAEESGFRELVSFVKEDYLVEPAAGIVIRDALFQSDPILVEKFVRGTLKGLSYVKQNRSGTIPVLANLMKIQNNTAGKVYDLVLPGLTMDGSLSQEMQRRIIEFITRVQGIKEIAAPERIFDFSPVRKIRVELEAKKWKPEA
jgi:ABC-type nitrate/sulfonate/bicarbonate transport system substrate-binding protein